jgi:hypothetical protein
MMDADALAHRLWPAGSGPDSHQAYMLLDGARDPRIEPMLRAGGLPHVCLYAGSLTPALASAAPYLVQIAPGSRFFRNVFPHAWGNVWGIYATAPPEITLAIVRRHFRTLLRAADGEGRLAVFRYYDPRVLRPYLASCSAAELGRLLGPLQRVACERADGGGLVEVAADPALRRAGSPQRNAQAHAQAGPGIVALRPSQWRALSADANARLRERLGIALAQAYPALAARFSDDAFDAFVRRGTLRAQRWGLRTDRSLGDYLSLQLQLGPGFDLYPPVRAVLEDTALPPEARLQALFSRLSASQWAAAKEHA